MNFIRFIEDRLSKGPIVFLLISIGIVNFFVFLPYLKWHLLIGWDTPWYLYYIFYVEEYGVAATFMGGVIDKPGYALILYALSKLGADPEQLLKVIPLAFASLFIVSIYILSKEGSHDAVLASLAAIFSSCTLATLRLANDLHPHLLALGFMMIGMYLHLKYVNNGDSRYIIFSMINAIFTLLIHSFTYGVYIFILMLSVIITRAKKSQKFKREVISTVACILPMMSIVLFLLFTSLRPIITLVEGLLNPTKVFPLTSQLQLRNVIIHSAPLFIFSITGIAVLLRSESTFKRILLAWTTSFLLAALLSGSIGITFAYRFILILPFPILAAYGFRGWPNKARLKYLKYSILIAVMVTNLSAATLHQLHAKPKIDEELREELIWVRENLGDKVIIPIYPLDTSKGYWALGIVGDYLYYGEVLPLLAKKPENYPPYPNLDISLYWKRLEDDEVLRNLGEYEIVLVGDLYELGTVDEQITEKVVDHDIYIVDHSVVTNESKIDYYYHIWRRFKDTKIAVIGWDWHETRKILYELWIPSVPAWLVPPQNIQFLGTTGLAALDNSTKYDVLILANWEMSLNENEAEKLLEYSEEDCAIVATFQSIYELYTISPQIVEDIFGIKEVHPTDVLYSNLTYCTQHYITSNFSIPFNSTGAEHGVPVSNFTTAQGIAAVTSFEDLYLLVVNEKENNTRVAHFGLKVAEMSEHDVVIFKRLLLWALHLEACLK